MNNKIRKLTGVSILIALVVILQFLSNYITFGPVNITLALIPIVLAGIIYGPVEGFVVGAVLGAIVLVSPSTGVFLSYKPVTTVFLCLLKTGLAGLAAGFIFKPFKGRNELVGSILASIAVPIINTGLFSLITIFVFREGVFGVTDLNGEFLSYFFLTVIGINFLIEFAVNSALSPAIYKISKIVNSRFAERE